MGSAKKVKAIRRTSAAARSASSAGQAPKHSAQVFGENAAPCAPASWRPTVAAAGLIALAAVAAYHNSFGGPFVYDDTGAIEWNRTIRQLWPIWPVLSPPSNGETVAGRPVLNLSLAINYALGGYDVRGYHLANLAIHILAALLLFGILRRTFLMPPLGERFGGAATALALASTLIWTVHPLQTESITYVSQRAESLAGFFYLLTLYCVIRGAGTVPFFAGRSAGLRPAEACAGETPAHQADAGETPALHGSSEKGDCPPSPRDHWSRLYIWYATAVLACLLGMATKEIVATAPLVALLYDRAFMAGSFREALRRRWGLYLGLAAGWGLLIYLVLSTGLIFRQPEMGAPGRWGYAWTQPGIILYYLRLCVWPNCLCFDYGWPVARTFWEIAPGILVVAALVAATVWGLMGGRVWGFLGAWFLLILAPTSSILPLGQLAFEHRLYLSLAAVAVLAVTAGYVLWEQFAPGPTASSRKAILMHWAAPLAVLAAVLLGLGCATVDRNSDYRSFLSIWQDSVAKRPYNPVTRYNLGVALAAEGRTSEAIEQYRETLRLNPVEGDAHFNLGVALVKIRHAEEAIEHYREAIRLKPDYVDAYNNLGMLLVEAGKIDEAMKHFREAARLRPDSPDAHYNLGLALAGLGRTQEAIEQYQQAVRLKPEDATARNNLGLALATLGKTAEAIEHHREALRLKPEDAAFHNNLAIVLAAARRTDEAIEHYQHALRLKGELTAARYNLASLLEGLGRTKEAIEHYDVLLQQMPDSTEILRNVAWLLATAESVESEDAVSAGETPALRAVQLAQRARELSGRENVPCLDTLAAAYAAAGRFDDAVILAQRAVQLAQSSRQASLAKQISARLELYRAGRPYRRVSDDNRN